MKKLLAVFLVALAACDDSPSGPARVDAVFILLGSNHATEQSLRVGETLQLTARLADAANATLTGRTATWSSSDQTVASVDGSGLVRALAEGSASIVAAAEGRADTVRVNVIVPPPSSIACAEGAAGLALAVGEVHTTTAAEAATICLDGGGSGSEYTYIPFNASQVATSTIEFTVAGGGLINASGPPNPSRGPSPSRALGAGFEPQRDVGFHLRMLRDQRERFREVRDARAGGPRFSRAGALAAVPTVGQRMRLNAQAASSCTNADVRTGIVEAVTDYAIIVADTLNPSGGFTRAEYRSFGITFDTLVHKVNTRNFGELESDLDGNGRIVVFFTEAVNRMTEVGSGTYVGGFYYGRDLQPTTGPQPCAGSNEAEMFYLMVPDTARAGKGDAAFTKEKVLQTTIGVLAHEHQHLLNFAGRVARGAQDDEVVWLNEGLSHIAEELVFYEAASLGPRTNLGFEEVYGSPPTLGAWKAYAASNFGRFLSYLEAPEDESLMGVTDELATRGATWAFLRYAADRLPGDDTPFWRSLVNTKSFGVPNLRAAFGAGNEPIDWMQDWTVSVYTDDAPIAGGVLPVEAKYTQPSWNYRTMTTAFVRIESYPLRTIALVDGTDNAVALKLKGGGAAFLRFGIAPGGRAAIRADRGGVPLPASQPLRISIVRTK